MTYVAQDPLVMRQVFRIVQRDMRRATSPQDLSDRLAQKGYGLRRTKDGPVLVTMPHGVELGLVPKV